MDKAIKRGFCRLMLQAGASRLMYQLSFCCGAPARVTFYSCSCLGTVKFELHRKTSIISLRLIQYQETAKSAHGQYISRIRSLQIDISYTDQGAFLPNRRIKSSEDLILSPSLQA